MTAPEVCRGRDKGGGGREGCPRLELQMQPSRRQGSMASSASEFHGARAGGRQVSGIIELYFFICPKEQVMSVQQE